MMTPSQIRRLRKRLGMSVRDFAAALGYSPRNGHVSVYRLESGDRRPSQQTIMLMKQLAMIKHQNLCLHRGQLKVSPSAKKA